jgi:uncharacterized protein (TIGR03067 family)
MKFYLFILSLVYALSCGESKVAKVSDDQKDIQGIWLAQTESVNGKTKEVSYVYEFKGDQLSFKDETGKEMKYLFNLDTMGNVKLIVIRPINTVADSTPISVGYALNGDLLKIVVAPPGLRPNELSDKNDQELIICKRKDL